MTNDITVENIQSEIAKMVALYRNNNCNRPIQITIPPQTLEIFKQMCEYTNHFGMCGRYMGMEIVVDDRMDSGTIIISGR